MKYQTIDFFHLLPAVQKPSRYINSEINSSHKRPQAETVNFCLAFPDSYEVGFSNLGLKILYSIINNCDDAMSDRVYAPWTDFGDLMKEHNVPLFGVESRVALSDFDIVGFTLQSELTYTNILYMLELSGIPLLSNERSENDPLVIAGGPGSAYPEALSIFFDAFVIGDGEEVILEIKNLLKEHKKASWKREKLLSQLHDIKGVYVPLSGCSSHIKARKYHKFSTESHLKNQLISWQQVTHDRYVNEIMRGCSRGCRFCFAGMFYRPVREKKYETILEEVVDEVRKSGWEEVGLLSLSSADYSQIKTLLLALSPLMRECNTDVNLPSLRVDSIDDNIIKLLDSMRQTGVTIAPEAGSQRLRDIINKDITEEQILQLVEIAVQNNWKILKLYFMIGLPLETNEDIEEIIALVEKIIYRSKNRLKINITLSPFIPKPHTPFQWEKMTDRETLLSRIYQIKNKFSRNKSIKIKYHDVENSLLECVLGRGDEKVGELLLAVNKKGARFDGWDEHFRFDKWAEAANEIGLDFDDYCKEIPLDDKLTWDHIDIGIKKSFLLEELSRAKDCKLTYDCRSSECTGCGVCNDKSQPDLQEDKTDLIEVNRVLSLLENSDDDKNLQRVAYRYRIHYAKKNELKFVAYLDMLRMIHRIMKATELPILYTRGFNKHPKIDFCSPLSVGVAGANEFFEIELALPVDKKKVFGVLPKIHNIEWKGVYQTDLDDVAPKTDYLYEHLVVEPAASLRKDFIEAVNKYNNAAEWIITKKNKEINLKEKLIRLSINESGSRLTILKPISGANIFDIVLGIFGIEREQTGYLDIFRAGLHTLDEIERSEFE